MKRIQISMRTEKEKMLAGEIYDACDAELLIELNAVKVKCQQYNNLLPTDFETRNQMLIEMLGQADKDTFINQPFYCDYGKHIRVGKRFFANFGLTILDEALVTIGDDCFIGPGVHIYTACHSTNPIERATRREWAECDHPSGCDDWRQLYHRCRKCRDARHPC